MSLYEDENHQLILDGLDLTAYTEDAPHEDGYWFEVQGADFTVGSPAPIMQTIDTLLRDGSMVERTGDDNREPGFVVVVCADPDNGDALAKGEAALVGVTGHMAELLWRPPHTLAAPTVFEIVTSWLEDGFDDIELLDGEAVFTVRLIAAPYGRDETETVTVALTAGAGSATVISDGTSATGVTSPDGAVTVSSGKLLIPAQAVPDDTYDTLDSGTYGVYTPEATFAIAAADFSTTPFFYFDFEPSTAGRSIGVDKVYANGVELTKVANYVIGSGRRRAVYYCADTSVTSLRLVFEQNVPLGSNTGVLVDNVTRGPRSPKASTTGRETLRIIDVGGTARTQASLEVSHETAGLGDVLVYTAPGLGNGYSPDLRQFYVSGGSDTSDAATVTGRRTTLDTSAKFDVPAASLPRGGYILYARLRAATVDHSRAVDWTATTRVNGTDQGFTQSGTSDPIALTTGAWTIVPLGGLVLRDTDVSDVSTALVRVTVARNGSAGASGEIQVDQVWAFYCGDGSALTFIPAGAGTPALGTVHNRVWLESPTLVRPVPSVWKGTLADKSDRFHAGIGAAFERHDFEPGQMGVHVVTTGAADALVSNRYFRRWLSRAQLQES